MTLEELKRAAENGNAEAMFILGMQTTDPVGAWNWFAKGSEYGHSKCAYMCLCQGISVTSHALENARHADVLQYYNTCVKCFQIVLDNSDISKKMREAAIEYFREICYRTIYAAFVETEYSVTKQVCSSSIGLFDDDRAKVILGLCHLVDKKFFKGYKLLCIIETNFPELENDSLSALAWKSLADLYLSRFPNIPYDVERSYHCVLQASKYPVRLGAMAKDELKKYYKNLLGGYSYTG